MILLMMLVIKAAFQDVVIYFDEKSMFIGVVGGNFKRYLQRDIKGMYSYSYNERERSHLSLTIVFNNGKKLYLTDSNLFERKDKQKAQMLKHFLSAAKKRLDLKYINKDCWRSLQGVGACWYAYEG